MKIITSFYCLNLSIESLQTFSQRKTHAYRPLVCLSNAHLFPPFKYHEVSCFPLVILYCSQISLQVNVYSNLVCFENVYSLDHVLTCIHNKDTTSLLILQKHYNQHKISDHLHIFIYFLQVFCFCILDKYCCMYAL